MTWHQPFIKKEEYICLLKRRSMLWDWALLFFFILSALPVISSNNYTKIFSPELIQFYCSPVRFFSLATRLGESVDIFHDIFPNTSFHRRYRLLHVWFKFLSRKIQFEAQCLSYCLRLLKSETDEYSTNYHFWHIVYI